jgi:hypothetical protein
MGTKVLRAWVKGFAPYAAALSRLKLPRRYKARDPRNLNRVIAVCDALHAVKVKLDAKRRRA